MHAEVAERLERHGVGDDAGFHVAAAAAVEAAVAHHRLEGRVGPHVLGSGRHHVDMAVEDQRAPGVTPRLVDADDVFLARVAPVHRREARLILDGVHVYLELVDGQPEPGEDFRHMILGRGLVAERRAVAHQIGQHGHRLVVQRVGGGDDLGGARRGVHRGQGEAVLPFYAARSSAALKVSGSTLPPETITATVLPRQSYLPAIAAASAVAPPGSATSLR